MSTIALQLRESTRNAHNSAEGHNFQKELASGSLPLPLYKSYLSQLFLVHAALEKGMAGQPYMGLVVSDPQLQTGFLTDDLKALGIEPAAVKPLPVTAAMLDRIKQLAAQEPVALLGYHYVLLGSKHGGKFIAATTKKSYDLQNGGCCYFDPYGQEFQQHWQHFTSGINTLTVQDTELEALLAAASEMFQFVEQLGGAVLAQIIT